MKRWLRSALVCGALFLLLLLAVREAYAPRLTLHVRGLLTRSPSALTHSLTDALDLRLHSTSRPYVGKIATLQKGLVLVHDNRVLIEEGYGFGLPIIEATGTAYLSRHAETSAVRHGERVSLVKAYHIDVADRPTRPFQVKYADVEPLGTVVFTYTMRGPDAIEVSVDFTGLTSGWDRAYVMNEQGARAFTRYTSPSGKALNGTEVGIWEETTAPFGCWEAPAQGVRFCVETTPGQHGFVGRERYRQYNWLGYYTLSWSGIDLVVDATVDTYTYTIHVQEGLSR